MYKGYNDSLHVQKFIFNSLDIFSIWSFSIAQPIFGLLSVHATFLVAHNCGPIETLLFVFTLSLFLPACLVSIEFFFFLIHRPSYKILHHVLIGFLIMLFALPLLKKLLQVPAVFIFIMAGISGFIFVFVYIRFFFFRKILKVFLISVLLSPSLFIFTGQSRALIFSKKDGIQYHVDTEGKPPIVMVMFDEIAAAYLQDGKGNIDARRFPNFAKLASDSYWFPNALAVADNTYQGVPAILTGQCYTKKENRDKIPALSDYQNNLFTLLHNAYKFNVVETSTRLSPDSYETIKEWVSIYTPLLTDTAFVFLHIVSPLDATTELPDITQSWEDFLNKSRQKSRKSNVEKAFGGKWMDFFLANQKSRDKTFRGFVASIKPSAKPVLNFIDIGLPHMPMEYYPSGKKYSGYNAELVDNYWPKDDWYVKGHFQRYMLQLGFVDTLLGELISKLKKSEIYDQCLLAVLADHGVSYRPGDRRRAITATNFMDLMSIPLFIKLPNQKKGIVDVRYVESIDILPSMMDIIKIRIPWNTDGTSFFSSGYREKSEFTFSSQQKPHKKIYHKRDIETHLDEQRHRIMSIFTSGTTKSSGFVVIGPYNEIIGKIPETDIPVIKGDFRSNIVELPFFDNLDLSWDSLPLYVSGSIKAPPAYRRQLEAVAISINNRISATAKLLRNDSFAAMLPEEALQPGKNSIEVLGIVASGDGNEYLLRGENSAHRNVGEYVLQEQTILNKNKQKRYSIVPFAVKSYLDSVTQHPNNTEFIGWAADDGNGRLVDSVIVFADGQSVYVTQTSLARHDVAKFYKDDGLIMSGFRFLLGNNLVDKDLRIFAISGDLASEAVYPVGSKFNKVRMSPFVDDYMLEEAFIVNPETKEKWNIKPNSLQVTVDRAVKKYGKMEFAGWAFDGQNGKLVDRIIIFVDGHSVLCGPTNLFRNDVAMFYRNEKYLRSGFKFIGPGNTMHNIRVFAIAGKIATEAHYPKDFQY